MFECEVHEDDKFTHDSGEGDFGGFTCAAQSLIKRFELTIGTGRNECGHVKRAAHRGATTTNAAASVPLTALTRMRGQSGERGRLAAIERAQLGQFGQHAQCCNGADAGDGFEFLHPFIQRGHLGAQFPELRFDLFQIAFQPPHEALGLATQGGQAEPFGLLALGHEDFQDLHPAANQFGQLLFLFRARSGGFGLQGLAVSGQDGSINVIGLGALTSGARKVADARRIQDADGHVAFMQCRDHVAFVTASGFADDLDAQAGRPGV